MCSHLLNYTIDQALELVNNASCHYFEELYTNSKRKIDVVMRLVELYRPYLFFKAMYVVLTATL